MILFIKNLVFVLMVPGSVVVYIPLYLLRSFGETGSFDAGGLRFVGIPLIAAGALLLLWSIWDFGTKGGGTPAPIDPPKELVAVGPYRWTRNPMYVGILSVLLGETVFFGSTAILVYAVIIFTCVHCFVVLYEEPHLRKVFGESYERYCEKVPRWVGIKPRQT